MAFFVRLDVVRKQLVSPEKCVASLHLVWLHSIYIFAFFPAIFVLNLTYLTRQKVYMYIQVYMCVALVHSVKCILFKNY
jgi:hypothetical protein